jgi:hypothetical protein
MSRVRVWVPEYSHPDPLVVQQHIGIQLEGIYHVELLDKHTHEVKFSSTFNNIITDAGLDRLMTGTDVLESLVRNLEAGTGTTAPNTSDTTLVAPVTPRSSGSGNFPDEVTYVDSGSYAYTNIFRTRIFNDTEANGVLTELGFFNAPTAGIMFSRVLIKDGTGTPTSIVKTSNDILRVRYNLRVYLPTNNNTITGSFTWRGVTYSSSIRAYGTNSAVWGSSFFNDFGSWNASRIRIFSTGSLTDVTGSLNGWSTELNTIGQVATNLTYTNGLFVRDVEFVLGPTLANGSGSAVAINLGSISSLGITYQQVISPPIVKTSAQTLTLRYRLSVSRRTEIA